MIPKPANLHNCFSLEFLALKNFDEYYTFVKGEKLVKMLERHPHYNTPPFSNFDPRWPRPAFLLTGSSYAVVDLDNCFKDGQPKQWAEAFLRKHTQQTAHEISVSGKGAHVLLHITEPLTSERGIYLWDAEDGQGKAELYVDTKWIALTGRPIFGQPHPAVRQISIAELRSLMDELATIRPIQVASGGMKDTGEGPPPKMATGFDIERFIEWVGIPVRAKEGIYYRLERCPWSTQDESSTHFAGRCLTNPAITYGETLGFKCHHPSCARRNISDLMRWCREHGRGQCPVPLWEDLICPSASDIFGSNPLGGCWL